MVAVSTAVLLGQVAWVVAEEEAEGAAGAVGVMPSVPSMLVLRNGSKTLIEGILSQNLLELRKLLLAWCNHIGGIIHANQLELMVHLALLIPVLGPELPRCPRGERVLSWEISL